jgi:Ca2+-binding RTX toxin-like protein
MIGGALGDVLISADGNDILFGDFGMVAYSAGSTVVNIVSLDIRYGGDDTLNGGAGNDILIGGQGRDLLYGTLSEDLLFGSYAALTLTNGIVSRIFFDMNDFMSQIMLGQFKASLGDRDDEDTALAMLADWTTFLDRVAEQLSHSSHAGSLLDILAFRNIFALEVFEQARHLSTGSLFDVVSISRTVSLPPGSTLEGLISEGGDAASEGESQVGPGETADSGTSVLANVFAGDDDDHSVPQPMTFALSELGSDAIVLGFGLLGLNGTRQPEAKRHHPVCRYGIRGLNRGVASRVRQPEPFLH